MKVLGVAAAAAIALAPFSVVITAPGVAQGAPCAGDGSNPVACQHCLFYVQAYHTSNVCYSTPAHTQAPPSTVELPSLPPLPPVPVVPIPSIAPSPPAPPPTPVQPAKINPLPPGAPRTTTLVTPPKELNASSQAIAAAKEAPAARINPAAPPKPPTQVDFDHQVQNVVNNHSRNVDLIKADNQTLPRPPHWGYVDYDSYHRPTLYNPLNQAMTFRYFYDHAVREAYVAAGGHVVLDAAIVGLYPFTAVGETYVASGSFNGGAWIPPDGWNGPPPPDYIPPPPLEVYQDVAAYVPSVNQTVGVGQVQVVGHDDSQPAGSQDTFLLDDSTLAWGQINDANSFAQIKVTKTQPMPGVGPTDNGTFLVALATATPNESSEPSEPSESTWPLALGYGSLAVAAGFLAWMRSRRKGSRAESESVGGGEGV